MRGTQFEFGHWVDLSEHESADDLRNYISNHFKDADKKRPLLDGAPREEIMITSFEGFPEFLYSESMDFDKLYEYMAIADKLESPNWIDLFNQYCELNSYHDDVIYDFDDDFFETFYNNSPMKAAQAVFFR